MNAFLDDLPGGFHKSRREKKIVITTAKVVEYHIIHCPECNGVACPVYCTRRPVRFHRCKTCGAGFKSIEV